MMKMMHLTILMPLMILILVKMILPLLPILIKTHFHPPMTIPPLQQQPPNRNEIEQQKQWQMYWQHKIVQHPPKNLPQSNDPLPKVAVVKRNEKKPLDIMYPTKRGMTVDSREIIASGLARQNLRAIRLKHILFASEELAEASLSRVRSSELTFEELAQQISNCAETREHGGEVGWVNVDGFFSNLHISTNNDDDTNHYNKDTSNEHLDAILPEQARFQTLQLSTKVCTLFLPFFLFKIVLTMITTIFVHSHKIMFKKKIIMK